MINTLIAPNGKPSNLNAEQYALVRTPAFKKWFGDWENDPQNASKVVDENGEPLVVYHGSNKKFNKFKDGIFENHIFFTNDKEHSGIYGDVLYECFINIKNPSNKLYTKETLKEKKFDGFINNYGQKDFYKEKTNVYTILKSNQIKLADGSNTTFDASSPDIRYADGGAAGEEITCINCGWNWNTSDSDESDKYVCHKCGFDNKLFYDPRLMGIMADATLLNLKKNGILLRDKENKITLIAYNTGNQKRGAALYNTALIYKSIKSIRQANEIIEMLDNQEYEQFDESKIEDYKKSNRLIIMNQNEVVYDSEKTDLTYADGGGVGDFKRITTEYLGIDESFEDTEYRYKDASIRYSKLDKEWILDMQHDDKPRKTIGGYKTLKIAKEVAIYYLNNPKMYADGGLIAPNGNQSNLTEEQYRLVRTPAFKKWFGDWENDPKNASKVVDENGEPLVVYHGTTKGNVINEFYDRGNAGIHFGTKEAAIERREQTDFDFIGYTLIEVFLNIKNPLIANKDFNWEWEGYEYEIDENFDIRTNIDFNTFESYAHRKGLNIFYDDESVLGLEEILYENGYDGVFYKNEREDKGSRSYVVTHSNQIKLADGTNTTFDAKNLDIRYADGGKTSNNKKNDLINPSIKNSNLEREQYKIVRTSQFKNWFGDWQKDPKNSSKVVDDNGEPMVVWHGSPLKFNIFKTYENGIFYFAENAGYAEYFTDGTKNIKPYFLNIRKIFDATKFDIKENEVNIFIKEFGISTKWLKKQEKLNKRIKFWELLRHDEDFRKYLKNEGYDGVKYLEDNDDGWIEESIAFGCFNANQIKLANGINTTFVTKNKDIRYADGGDVDFGEVLFGEDEDIRILQPKGLEKREPNTEYENELQKAIYEHTMSSLNKEQIIKNKSLLESATNQFPELLRPKISPFDENFLFRGVSFSEDSKDNIIEMLGISIENPLGDEPIQFSYENSSEKFSRSSVIYGKYYQKADFGIKDFEFTSWTTDYNIANRFNGSKGFVYAVSFERSDDLYLRPKISNAISSYKENEILFYNEGRGISTNKADKDSFEVKYIYILYSADNLARLFDTDIYTIRNNINARPISSGSTSEIALQHDLNILNNVKLAEDWFKKGGLSKTPAPKKDRVFGSDKNKVGSAASDKSAKEIRLDDSIVTTLQNKAKEYNKDNSGNKVSLNTLKAVMRRGMGAYSTSHRPTITGGAPNSRQAWGFARVNKFLKKKSGEKVKAAYVQDDDLLESGAILNLSCKDYISENEAVLKTGYYLDLREFSSINDPYGQIPLNLKHTLVTYNSGNQDGLSLIDTINPISLQKELAEILNIPMNNAHVVVGLYIKMAKKLKSVSDIKSDNIIVMDRDRLVCKSDAGDLFRMGGNINKNNLKMTQHNYQSMKPIGEIQVGDVYLIKEDMFAPHQDHEHPQHLSTRYATVEVKSPCHKGLDAYVLEVMECDCDHAAGKYAKGKIIERSRKHILSSGKLKSAVAKPTEFKDGGELNADSQEVKKYFSHDSGNAGGLLVGKRHSEGGIKADVKSTGQRIEMEGGEAVITRGAVNSKKKYVYDGKEMTTREILSDLNVKGGGVAFADGGDVPEKMNCGCSSMKVGGISYTPQDFITLSEKEYQEHRLIDGIEKERNDHFYTLAKLNSGAISIEQALREIASKEMMIDPKYPYSE